MEGVLDLCNRVVSDKMFLPLLPIEYMTVSSGRTDAPEVTCDLTDTHTDPTAVILAAHVCRAFTLLYIGGSMQVFQGGGQVDKIGTQTYYDILT